MSPIDTHPIPEGLLQVFRSRGTRLDVREGATILHAGDPCTHVYLVQSGRVRFSLLSEAGREPILSEVGEQTIFGELAAIDSLPRAAIASAVADTVLFRMGQTAFMELLREDWDANLWVLRHLGGLLRSQTEQTFRLATLTSRARLVHELLTLTRGADGDDEVIVDLPTHSELAARIGSHREAVTRELGGLRKAGLLRQDGRKLVVLDMARLQGLIAG